MSIELFAVIVRSSTEDDIIHLYACDLSALTISVNIAHKVCKESSRIFNALSKWKIPEIVRVCMNQNILR